jgi:hypothetical protein
LSHSAHLNNHRGKVVVGAALMDYSLQLVGGALGVLVFGKHLGYLFIGQVPIDSVAAQEKARAVARADRLDFDFDLALDAERAIDDITACEFGGALPHDSTGANVIV